MNLVVNLVPSDLSDPQTTINNHIETVRELVEYRNKEHCQTQPLPKSTKKLAGITIPSRDVGEKVIRVDPRKIQERGTTNAERNFTGQEKNNGKDALPNTTLPSSLLLASGR